MLGEGRHLGGIRLQSQVTYTSMGPTDQQPGTEAARYGICSEPCLEGGFLWLNCLPVPVFMLAIKELKTKEQSHSDFFSCQGFQPHSFWKIGQLHILDGVAVPSERIGS